MQKPPIYLKALTLKSISDVSSIKKDEWNEEIWIEKKGEKVKNDCRYMLQVSNQIP